MGLLAEQTLNGLQFGFTLLMVSSGLTLIFGIMNVINLAHGSLFMVGAFVAADVGGRTGNFGLALLGGMVAAGVAGLIVEVLVIRRLYLRNHLDQVLATFGLVLMANQGVQMVYGTRPSSISQPAFLSSSVTVLPGVAYPTYRLAVIVAGLFTVAALYLIINRTRLGMWIRAGVTHRELLGAFGINVSLLYTLVFIMGAVLAGFAGVVASPFLAVEAGVGDNFLILSFVVIVIGGIGSLKGAIVGSLVLGLTDTMARTYLPGLFENFLSPSTAATVGASVAAASIYVVMVAVLMTKPNGLFGAVDG